MAEPSALFGGALSGAATGATLGSVLPGIGTGVGALIGAGFGLIKGAFFSDDDDVPGPFEIAKRAAVQNGLIPAGKAGKQIFRDALFNRDPTALQLFQQAGGNLARWTKHEQGVRDRRSRKAAKKAAPIAAMTFAPPFARAPVAAAFDRATSDPPPEIAALISFLQQLQRLLAAQGAVGRV